MHVSSVCRLLNVNVKCMNIDLNKKNRTVKMYIL